MLRLSLELGNHCFGEENGIVEGQGGEGGKFILIFVLRACIIYS